MRAQARLFLPFLMVSIGPLMGLGADTGQTVFRANCAFCHGAEGRGGRGPSLVSQRVKQSLSDAGLKEIIKNGIAGTGMPAFDMETDDLNALVAYVRKFDAAGAESAAGGVDAARGDAVHGRMVYDSSGCAGCHKTGDAGSVYGPDLSRIGAARSAGFLRESIVTPSAVISPDYAGVSVMTSDGQTVTGVRISEDTFTVEMRLPDQRFAGFEKSRVRTVKDLDQSLMPAFRLPAKDLDDLVAYLATLRGESVGAGAPREKGIQ